MSTAVKPSRRDERRIQTVREIKQLAMEQISAGGPDALSLSGIVREMSMSPAAVYRYFASRDALLADLVVDAYNDLADFLVSIERGSRSAEEHLDAVLRGSRTWALKHPNSYRLTFESSVGSGKDFAPERTIPAASRSMSVIINALSAVTGLAGPGTIARRPSQTPEVTQAFNTWAERSGLTKFPVDLLLLAFLTWTRLHGIVSLELGGHLAATGIGAGLLFDAEIATISAEAASLPRVTQEASG